MFTISTNGNFYGLRGSHGILPKAGRNSIGAVFLKQSFEYIRKNNRVIRRFQKPVALAGGLTSIIQQPPIYATRQPRVW